MSTFLTLKIYVTLLKFNFNLKYFYLDVLPYAEPSAVQLFQQKVVSRLLLAISKDDQASCSTH